MLRPCPIVADVFVAVQVTILNPAEGFADTCEVIVPAVLVTPAPLAFQFHAT